MRTSRTPEDWMVLRRVAVELLQDGTTQEAIAERLQVSRSSIKRWKKAFQQGGLAALAPKPRPPAARRLSASQAQQLREILPAGPLAAGFSSDLYVGNSLIHCHATKVYVSDQYSVTVWQPAFVWLTPPPDSRHPGIYDDTD